MWYRNHYQVETKGPFFRVSFDLDVQARTAELAVEQAVDAVVRGDYKIRAIQRIGRKENVEPFTF